MSLPSWLDFSNVCAGCDRPILKTRVEFDSGFCHECDVEMEACMDYLQSLRWRGVVPR
jgi:hypothetical protein